MEQAVYSSIDAIVDIFKCTFQKNQATFSGGAISSRAKKLVIRSSLFEYNIAANYAAVKMYSATVYKHTTEPSGGAIDAYTNSVAVVLNCSFRENRATNFGGAISTRGRKLLITSSLFEYNAVINYHAIKTYGGAVSAGTYSNIQILNCSFKKNKATYSGGAIWMTGMIIQIKSSWFEYNTLMDRGSTETFGGAISISDHHSFAEILNCSFKSNKATYAGGAVYIAGKKILIQSSLFEYNIAVGNNTTKTFGGAVCEDDNLVVDILNCSFKWNKTTYAGGAIYASGKKFLIKSSLLEYNTACGNYTACGKLKGLGGALYFEYNKQSASLSLFNNSLEDEGVGATGFSSIHIVFNCSFGVNMAKGKGGAIYSEGPNLTIKASRFNNNSVVSQGGAIFTYSPNLSVRISECSFICNRAILNGGAVCHIGGRLNIETSIFRDNTALGNSGEGGALYTSALFYNPSSHVNIFYCAFDGNQASFRGGAIMATDNFLYIGNSSFRSLLSYPQSEGYFGGELLYSKSMVILEHVSFLDADSFSLQNSLILHHNTVKKQIENETASVELAIYFKIGVHIKCLTGKNIAVSNNTLINPDLDPVNKFTFISVSCSFCPYNSYSLYTSHIDLFSKNHSIKKSNEECYHCPLGGVCERGKIQAAENFWGYPFGKEVRFTSCPFGYCCFNKECVNYFSCHARRTGILCSQCKKNFTENLITPDCLRVEKCRHPWYSLAVMITGIVYISVLMYITEITKTLKALLIPKFMLDYINYCAKAPIKTSGICTNMLHFIRFRFLNECNQGSEMQLLTDDVLILETDSREELEQMRGSFKLVSDEEMQYTTTSGQEDSEDNVLPGLLKIMIFFYQTNVLFKTHTGTKSHGFICILQETVSALFNLRTDGTFAQNLSWCPFNHLQPVSKVLLKSSFIIYLFFLIFLAFILRKIGRLSERLFKITCTKLNNIQLSCCILRLVFISYVGITTTCFSLLSCVQLGHFGKVLFINGSIQCYKWWQLIVICVVCCWIVPFPVSIYTLSKLLSKNKMSSKHFLLCLLFPLPAVC